MIEATLIRREEFPLTHWSLVFAVGADGTSRAEAALAELCRTYWYPLYAFARRKGYQPADAEDLTQGFFAQLVHTPTVLKADPQRGRFRSFLLGCFCHFLASACKKAQAHRRGGGLFTAPLDLVEAERRLAQEPSAETNPEQSFDRHWALAVLGEALERLEKEFGRNGRSTLFEQLRPYLHGDGSGPTYAEVAGRLGTTEGTIKVTVHRLRKRYREHLRMVVNQTVNSPLDTEAELAHLMAALRG